MKPLVKITTFSLLATFALTAKALPPAKFYTSVGIGYDSPSASIASYDPAKEFFEASLAMVKNNKKESGLTPEQKQQTIDQYATVFKNTTSIDKSHLAYELSSGVKFAMPNQRFSWGGELGFVSLPKVKATINSTEPENLKEITDPDAKSIPIQHTQLMTNRYGINMLASVFYQFKQSFNASLKLGVSYMSNKYESTYNTRPGDAKTLIDTLTSNMDGMTEAQAQAEEKELFLNQTKTITKVIPLAELGLSYQLPAHIKLGFNISHYFGKSVEFKNTSPMVDFAKATAKPKANGKEVEETNMPGLLTNTLKQRNHDILPNDVLADTVVMASVSYDF